VHDKCKVVAAPSSPSNELGKSVSSHMHLRYDCSYVISEIRPQGSTQTKVDSGNSKGTKTTKE
jgi:hypothetical protein